MRVDDSDADRPLAAHVRVPASGITPATNSQVQCHEGPAEVLSQLVRTQLDSIDWQNRQFVSFLLSL